MSGAPNVCRACGYTSSSDAKFCGRCGAPLAAEPTTSQVSPARPAHSTMLGGSLEDLPGAPSSEAARTLIDQPLVPTEAAAGAPKPHAKTMLGVAAVQLPEGWSASAATPPVESDTNPDLIPRAEPPPRSHNRTMLGVPAVDPAAVAQGAPPYSPPAAPASAPAAPVAPLSAQPPTAPVAPLSPQPPADAGSKRAALGPSNRTMLGVAAPAAALEAARARQEQAEAPAPQPYTPVRPAPDGAELTGELSIAGLPSPAKRGRGVLVAMLGLGVIVMFGVVAALAWWRFGPRASAIRASVAQSDQGEVLAVEVPGAPDGARVRFAGAEQPLASGRARLPLSADALHVGDNPLAIEVIAPNGATETHRVTLTLELRVRADLATLSAAEPAITVVVEALPGSTATLDGTPLALDAQGRGSRAYPIASLAPTGDAVVHTVRWTVQPPHGEAADGTLTTRVPLTSIQIDRPGAEVVTDRDRVEIAGAIPAQATVTIDGAPVAVHEGRFLHSYPVPQLGEVRPVIVARAPGRAPVTRTLTIRRVADLAREAASFEVDRSLTYARIAQNPAHYRGQRIALEGRVYNVDVQNGRSVLQMLVRDCPAGQRCPLWISYPAATEVTVESWVRVLGTVAGEQQFRSESGQVRTVPRVDAEYVLPARP